MNRKNISKSQSQNDLYSQLIDVKDRKKVFLKELKTNIKNTEKLIKQNQSSPAIEKVSKSLNQKPSHSLSSAPSPSKLLNRKQRSLSQLANSLTDRISIDRLATKKLENLTDQQLEKKLQLEKRIDEIKKRNQHRMKELEEFQNKYLKKINEDYMKDKEKQVRLLGQYEGVLQKVGKIKQTKQYRKAIELEDWNMIIKQKQKLQIMIREFTKKQQMLLRDQNPETLKKIQQSQMPLIMQQSLPNLSQEPRKPRIKVDAKQIGNQYLQYAKKLKEQPKQKPKIKLLDINFKCIDYDGQMLGKIARNTGDLSKVREIKDLRVTSLGKEKQKDKEKDKIIKQASFKSSLFEVKEDEKTEKYLKQIRSNLKQLQKTN